MSEPAAQRTKPVQFGIFDIMQVVPATPSRVAFAEHLAAAELADRVGLDYYFTAERHFMPFYRTPAPSVWLGAVAARTARIRLGTLAYTVALHNPMRLAEEISMLDHLSGGRIEVGVGLGHRPEELVSLGIDPRLRQPMLVEGVVLMQRAWRGEPFHHPGHAWKFQDLYVEAPLQRPFPPQWYAGNDPEAARWAALNGLSLAIGFQPDERLRAPSEAYHAAVDEVEQSTDPPERGPLPQRLALMRHVYVAESDEQAMEEMIGDLMAIGDAVGSLTPNPSPTGASARERGAGSGPRNLSRGEAEREVGRLREQQIVVAGGPETVAAALAATIAMLGLDVYLANPWLTGVDARRVERTIRLLAEEVALRVREMAGLA